MIHEHIHPSADDFQIMSIPLGVFKIVDQGAVGSILGTEINQNGTAQTDQQDNGGNDVKACLHIGDFPFHVVLVFLLH